ncbi:MAG: hypothetical protein ACF8Q5_10190 [Phycisphaerales bacterium JB040]
MMQRLSVACVMATGSVLVAQDATGFRDVEPRWVVTTEAATPLKSGNLVQLYAVAELAEGTVLRMDGESSEWVRVVYPTGVYPFVRASDARDLGNDRISLTRPSQLLAPNRQIGLAGSWRSVYRTALPAGTELEIVGRETNTDGDVTAYAVKPVVGDNAGSRPYGFIGVGLVRDATDEEVRAHLSTAEERPAAPRRDQTPANSRPANADPAQDVDNSLLDPIDITPPAGADDPALDEQDRPATDAGREIPGVTTPADGQPVEIDSGAVGTVEDDAYADEYGIRPARLVELEDAFREARQLPKEELDASLEELLSEFRRAQEAADDDAVKQALGSRIAWLEIRIETRDQRRKLDAFLAEADDARAENAARVREWQAGRTFDLVGRVLVSRVYDGDRLPKMYRLVGEDPVIGPRTLGYLPGNAEFDASQYVGQVIGVRGRIEQDPQTRLRIVEVDSVSVMPE